MNLSIMRKIDLIIGVPLCFLFTLVRRFCDLFLFGSRAGAAPVRKILLIKLSEMGALTLTYPLLVYLRKQYPQASFSFLVFENNASGLKLLQDFVSPENIFTIKDDSFRALMMSTLGVIHRVRHEHFDMALDLEFFSRFTSLLTYLSGAPQRSGFYRYHFEGLYRGDLLTHKIQFNPLLHCSRSYLSLGKAFLEERMDTPCMAEPILDAEMVFPRLDPDHAAVAAAWKTLRSLGILAENIYLMNPGDGILPLREWPLENFVALVQRILQDPKNAVILVGRKGTTDKDVRMHAAVNHERCFNLVDQTSVDELIAFCHLARALISNDCGLPHLASVTGVKRVVLFGPESPMVFAPVGRTTRVLYANYPCSPCLSALNHRQSSCQDNRCLQNISIEEAYQAVMGD